MVSRYCFRQPISVGPTYLARDIADPSLLAYVDSLIVAAIGVRFHTGTLVAATSVRHSLLGRCHTRTLVAATVCGHTAKRLHFSQLWRISSP